MISKYMRGRLGNQLFQYATIRKILICNDNNDEIKLNFSKYVYSKNFENELKYFKINKYSEVNKININPIQYILIMYYKVIKRIIRLICPKKYYDIRYRYEDKKALFLIKNGIYWKEDGKALIKSTNCKNKIVIGHYESKENFDSIREILLSEIEPKEKPLEKNSELYKVINNNNSVCVSIRRGDFITNPEFNKKFNVCGKKYFENAVKVMNMKVKNPVYIIFSDDIEWCKENIKFSNNLYFEDGTDPVWEKLRLMYSCKHFIISNSTFSWWAQYLSRNNSKIVIAPEIWRNIGYTKDIYDKNWVIVKN